MKVRGIATSNFKGLTTRVALTAPNVLLQGPRGSYKSTILEATRMALLLPTRYGDRNLGLLSPTGDWSVDVDLALGGGPAARLRRSIRRGSGEFGFGEKPVNRDTYAAFLAPHLDLKPYQVDLGEFQALSPQDRASLFASLLADGAYTMAEAVQAACGMPWPEFTRAVVGPEAAVAPLPAEGVARETPDRLVQIARAELNLVISKERDAKAAIERAEASQPADQTIVKAEAQSQLEVAMGEVGAVRSRMEDLDRQARAHDAAKRNVTALEQMAQNLQAEGERLAELRKTKEAKEATLAELRPRLEMASQQRQSLVAGIEEREAELKALVRPAMMIVGSFPDDAMDAAANEFLVHTTLVRKIVAFMVARVNHQQDAAIEEANRREAELTRGVSDRKPVLAQAEKDEMDLGRQIQTLENSIATLDGKLSRAPKVDEEKAALGDRMLPARQAVQDTAVLGDMTELQTLAEGLESRCRDIRFKLTEADRHLMLAGQVEQARLQTATYREHVQAYKHLLDRLQGWRDRMTGRGFSKIIDPMNAVLGPLMGAQAKILASGTGRSMSCTLVIDRPDRHDVRLEHLSCGETVLVAVAFVVAMQKMAAAPTTLLTLDLDGLPTADVNNLLRVLPGLGLDFVGLASNQDGVVADERWQVIACPPGAKG